MPVENHSLVKEFPEMKERIHQLKMNNNHFAKLFAEYDSIEHEVQHIESGAASVDDAVLETLKKKRLALKDALFALLKKAA
jgi:uncharacterized protein YdcH (DUF465 family)